MRRVPQLHKLVINVGKIADGYEKAGQFVQIKVGDSKPGFFAIASPPHSKSDGLLEVLIKDGSPGSAANLLCNASQGMCVASAKSRRSCALWKTNLDASTK